jgi:predicted ATPase/DNA-binding CsgD family transcriptional regulator
VSTRAAKLRPSNLPLEATSFVGRRQELREVKRLLATTRLLTLTGSGGVGKTRLALRAAGELARGFPDGVWLVPLASIQDPLLVSQAVFSALGAQDQSAGWSLETLTDYVAARRLLLVLDNCEHLLDACAVLASTLLRACPNLRLLATSRQALGVAGEVRMPVPPMALPDEGDEESLDVLANAEAVSLLSERAGAVLPGFAVNAENAGAVLQLCRRLDAIPLALELAAVRLGALSLDQLNEGLATELTVLGSANRGAEARQQTLEATIGWSYGLLDEVEQLLWARLSAFAGGFDAEAAIAVCCDERVPSDRLVELLGALVEKSIVRRDLRSGNAPRYSLLETIRQYGNRRLRAIGEETRTRQRHLDWMAGVARAVGAFDNRQVELFRRMDFERNNVWAALEFCLSEPRAATRGADLAHHLVPYWTCRGPFGDLRRVLAALAEQVPDDSGPRAHFLRAAGAMASSQNDFDASVSLARESVRVSTLLNDSPSTALSLAWLAIPLGITGNLTEAIEAGESALTAGLRLEDRAVQLVAMAALCSILPVAGQPERSIELGEQALALSREWGELWARGYVLMATSQAHWRQGDTALGEAQAREGAAAKHALDDRAGLQGLLQTLAWMASQRAAHRRAATLLGCAERARRSSALSFQEGFRAQHEESSALALKGLGQGPFAVAHAEGLAMTIDDAVAFAIEDRLPGRTTTAKTTTRTPLTKRELEVARLIADDMTTREIASTLFISERTVETHVTNMLNKLGLNSRVQLTRWIDGVESQTPPRGGAGSERR